MFFCVLSAAAKRREYAQYRSYYTVDANGNHTIDPDITLAQLTPPMIDLYKAVNDALLKMDALAKEGQ